MKRTRLMAALVAAGFLGAAATADANILGQDSNGDVFLINTSDAKATLFKDLNEVGGVNSPNGLGYVYSSNTAFRSTFPANTGPRLYRDNEDLTGLTGDVASGTVYNGEYYYINNDNDLFKVSGIFGAANSQTNSNLNVSFGNGAQYGDITIRDGILYGSYLDTDPVPDANKFVTYDLSNGTLTEFSAPTGSALDRYAGLAFSGNALYGVKAFPNNEIKSELFLLDLDFVNKIVTATSKGLITYNDDNVRITDAAEVPIPAALPMLLAAMGGLGFAGWRSKRRAATPVETRA